MQFLAGFTIQRAQQCQEFVDSDNIKFLDDRMIALIHLLHKDYPTDYATLLGSIMLIEVGLMYYTDLVNI